MLASARKHRPYSYTMPKAAEMGFVSVTVFHERQNASESTIYSTIKQEIFYFFRQISLQIDVSCVIMYLVRKGVFCFVHPKKKMEEIKP